MASPKTRGIESELFVSLHTHLDYLSSHLHRPEQYDQMLMAHFIVLDTMTDYILEGRYPTVENVVQITKELYEMLLHHGGLKQMINNRESALQFRIGEGENSFELKPLNAFLADNVDETIEERAFRVNSTIKTIALTFPTMFSRMGYRYPKKAAELCEAILCQVAEDHYFLTNEDIVFILDWLVQQWANSNTVFSLNPDLRDETYPVIVRDVNKSLTNLPLDGMRTKSERVFLIKRPAKYGQRQSK
jgi:hypothetical protein